MKNHSRRSTCPGHALHPGFVKELITNSDLHPGPDLGQREITSEMIGTILQQLLNPEDNGNEIKDQAARRFFKRYKERREDVVARYFKLFNSTIFDNKLPADFEVVWKNRLLKTAGFCIQEFIDDRREAHIELASKVCDSPERIRDVLVHEMCHAASWLIDGIRDCHGPGWRYWADKVNQIHPELPPVSPYHEYSIATKYIYRCTKCGVQTGRHSKSVDIDRYVCGHCEGKIQLLRARHGRSPQPIPQQARAPGGFAKFVRQHYRKLRQRHKELSSQEIMKQLSDEFAKKSKNSNGDEAAKRNNCKRKRKRLSEEDDELFRQRGAKMPRSDEGGGESEIEVDSDDPCVADSM